MGTTINCPEVRYYEAKLTPQDRAEARDAYVRAFEDQFSNWAGIAKACIDVDRDKDYLLLGYKSWHAWLLEAAPMSRSYIYIVVGRYKELEPDIPHEELVQMPSASAKVLQGVSSTVRRNPELKSVAIKAKKASEVRTYLREKHPEQHISGIVERKLKFTTDQWDRIELAFETYQMANPGSSLESFIDWLVVEFQ